MTLNIPPKRLFRVICICKGIPRSKICAAIENGCSTVTAVNQKTGSGSGGCNATRCGPVITELVKNKGYFDDELSDEDSW